jgi:3-oxoacyl-[acyl-carrier-protein] synthase II
MNPVITAFDLITPFGHGMAACWQGLLGRHTAIQPLTRFPVNSFTSHQAACVPGLDPARPESLFMQLVMQLLAQDHRPFPDDAQLVLATTAGEVDLLETAVIQGSDDFTPSRIPASLARLTRRIPSLSRAPISISAACASSTVALALAADEIRHNPRACFLIIAADSVNEFVYSGFSSLMALDPLPARPFDAGRRGLSLGEAAAWALVMSDERAAAQQWPIIAELSGSGLSNDANHMTGPSRDGSGLVTAIQSALASAGLAPDRIHAISAHGTGTAFNDAMEMKAFRSIFDHEPIPTYSIKGAIGHTLGTAGLVETLVAVHSLHLHTAPPTVGLQIPDPDAAGWVSPSPVSLPAMTATLTTNSGFGGINAALILSAPAATAGRASSPSRTHPAPPTIVAAGWIDPSGIGCRGGASWHRPLNAGQQESLCKDGTLFDTPPKNSARFDIASRHACIAIALALKSTHIKGRQGMGTIAVNQQGCLPANSRYFSDYVQSGRVIGRGNLFVYTLPSSAISEAVIHFDLHGPTFHVSGLGGSPLDVALTTAVRIVRNRRAPAMLVVANDSCRTLAMLIAQPTSEISSLSGLAEISQLSDESVDLERPLMALKNGLAEWAKR